LWITKRRRKKLELCLNYHLVISSVEVHHHLQDLLWKRRIKRFIVKYQMLKNLLLIYHLNPYSNHFIHHRNKQLEDISVRLQGNSNCINSHHNSSYKNSRYSIKIDLRNSWRTSEQSLQRHSQLQHKMKHLQGIQNKTIISNNNNNNNMTIKHILVDVRKV